MKSLVFAGAVLIGLLAGGAARADTECTAPVATWQSREVLRKQLEQRGLQVHRIKVDDGCYEVRGIDAQGNRFKAKYAPDSLKALSMETKDDQHGERRRERGQGSR
ncbi:MAG: PepSY domain-containing protein [Burkholderiales bacterium]|nr:PepSY domain-containing protein [Burkholderiales bacterium]